MKKGHLRMDDDPQPRRERKEQPQVHRLRPKRNHRNKDRKEAKARDADRMEKVERATLVLENDPTLVYLPPPIPITLLEQREAPSWIRRCLLDQAGGSLHVEMLLLVLTLVIPSQKPTLHTKCFVVHRYPLGPIVCASAQGLDAVLVLIYRARAYHCVWWISVCFL
jgi:hypothetical protein